ncbi:MAG: hypothetical protein RJA87_2602 [Pseudomonadota bacterium]|jgi:hypothetical protein
MATLNSKLVRDLINEKERALLILETEIATLKALIDPTLVKGATTASVAIKRRLPRSELKKTVLDILAASASLGISTAALIDKAKILGFNFERASVSSTLSRLKSDGVVQFDGNRYRLIEHEPAAIGWMANVHPLPASKG